MKKQIRNSRNGVTMIELLVVATIVLSLMVISVPMIKPMIQSQSTSNAASVVSTYLNRARTRAMRTGRPCGVVFEAWPGANVSLVMRQVEMPPLYSGLTDYAQVTSINPVSVDTSVINNAGNTFTMTGADTADITFSEVIPYYIENTKIRFDEIGPYYNLELGGKNLWGGTIYGQSGTLLPNKSFASFEFYLPEKPTMTAPIGLPQGTVIDMEMSGLDSKYGMFCNVDTNTSPYTYSTKPKPTIMFGASGEVISASGEVVGDTIYILIGRWEKIPDLILPDEVPNYADANNFWVTINPVSGVVSTTEINPAIDNSKDADNSLNDEEKMMIKLRQSREFARMSKRNLGGH